MQHLKDTWDCFKLDVTDDAIRENIIQLRVKFPLEHAMVNMVDRQTLEEMKKLEKCLHDLESSKEVTSKSKIKEEWEA